MLLLISTYDNSHFSIAVGEDKIKKIKIVDKKYQQSELLLKEIDKIIKKEDLSGIIVVSGPGAFSGLRIGIATANALSYALKVPVVGVHLKKAWLKLKPREVVEKAWKEGCKDLSVMSPLCLASVEAGNEGSVNFVVPEYDQEPNIS